MAYVPLHEDKTLSNSDDPLLEVSELEYGHARPHEVAPLQKSHSRLHGLLAYAHITLLIIYAGLIVAALDGHFPLYAHNKIYDHLVPGAPGNEAIQLETRLAYDHIDNVFTGPPSQELDYAWHNLLEGTVIRITDSEMQELGRESIGVKGGGYMATPIVYHQLHCLKQLKRTIYSDHYFGELDERRYAHLNHCHEILRQAVMCKADMALTFYDWQNTTDMIIPRAVSDSNTKCAKWDLVEQWALERRVSVKRDLVPFEEALERGPAISPGQ